MNLVVDEGGRALLDVRISNKLKGEYSAVTTWIDTAFDGHLVLSLELIKENEAYALRILTSSESHRLSSAEQQPTQSGRTRNW